MTYFIRCEMVLWCARQLNVITSSPMQCGAPSLTNLGKTILGTSRTGFIIYKTIGELQTSWIFVHTVDSYDSSSVKRFLPPFIARSTTIKQHGRNRCI